MLQPMPAPGDRRDAETFHGPLEGVDDGGDGAVADDMESARDNALGAGEQMLGDRIGPPRSTRSHC